MLFKKGILKQKDGMIANVLPLMIVLIVVAALLQIMIGWYSTIDKKTTADTILRTYVLRMEARGYLSPDDKKNLEADLSEYNISISDWGKTTFSQVGVGEIISLDLTLKLKSNLFIVNAWDSISPDSSILTMHIKKISTAKW